MNKFFSSLLAGSLLTSMACAAQAAVVPVADFTTSTFSYSYSGGMNGTLNGTASGTFHFDNLLGGVKPPYTLAEINTLSGYAVNITITAHDSMGSPDDNHNVLDDLTVIVKGTSGVLSGVTLFEVTTGTATNGAAIAGQGGSLNIVGPVGGPGTPGGSTSGSVVASNDGLSFTAPPYVKYSSSVLYTLEGSGLTEENASLALTANTTATYSATVNPLIDTLDANTFFIGGNFAANVPVTTPEPGAITLGLVAFASCGVLRLRRRK
jgi:hypothetical protein